MQLRATQSVLTIGLLLGWFASAAPAQAPAAGGGTLWHFLGIPQGARYLRDNTLNRNGNRPALERKPPLKPIGDPKNLESKDASIKKAAEVKQAEDMKKQKIKAIKYLASIGCGCYNRDGSITDAMIKSMDDCTEEVRLATVQAMSEAAMGERCANCKQKSCCSEELSNKLYEIAYGRDEAGCYLEPSERVRLAAAEALRTCCEGGDDMIFMEPSPSPTPAGPGERPSPAPEVGGERPGGAPPAIIDPPLPPAVPLQNPPAPIVPPRAVPPAPAPAAQSGSQSSRRTAMLKAQPAQTETVPQKSLVIQQPSPSARPSAAAPGEQVIRVNPHWKPTEEQQSVFFRAPASGPLPIDGSSAGKPTPENVVVASLPQRKPPMVVQPAKLDATLGLAPIVTRASLTRLPPVDNSNRATSPSQAVPAPPLPAVPAATVLPVSTSKQRSTDAEPVSTTIGRGPPPVLTTMTPKQAPKKQTVTNTRPRKLPGSEFGTGLITSVRLKEGTAVIEFENDGAVPPGSIIRAYHSFALTGKRAVCDLQVVQSEDGHVVVIPNGRSELGDLSVGDHAVVLQ